VAALLGASHSSVKKWKTALARGGKEALAAKPPPPRPTKLSDAQKSQLVKMLVRGPLASGFRTDLWTCRRVAEVVQQRFGVSYHPDHLGRILHDLGFTPQKPEQLARKRDWPRIKKGRAAAGPASFFWTKQAFACSRSDAAPGRRAGKRRCRSAGIATTDSR
jgi:transposase